MERSYRRPFVLILWVLYNYVDYQSRVLITVIHKYNGKRSYELDIGYTINENPKANL